MATEIELKLSLKPKAIKRLVAHPLLKGLAPQKQRLLNTYYDTPELELHARHIGVRFRQKGEQWLLTVKSAEPASGGLAVRSEWEAAAKPGHFDFSHVTDPNLRHLLDQARERLQAVFTTDFRRQIWHVPFGESLIELAVDRGSIDSKGKSTAICEIELELLSGRIADIFGLTRALQEDIDLRPAIASKAERGYTLFNGETLRPFRAKPPALTPEMTPVEAFRSIALACLEHFQRNEPGLHAKGHPEFIHQARVALRRLRSAIKLFAPALPPDFVAAYGQTWRTLASALGDARNWDVFLDETLPPIRSAFPNDRDVGRLSMEGQRLAKRARRSVVSLLVMAEYPRLITEFTAAIYALNDVLPRSLRDFANKRLAVHARQARQLAKRHATLQPAERHQMRIRFKKLRYALEFLGGLLPQKKLLPYLAALSQLQDELGLINDQVTAENLLKEVLKSQPPGPVHGWISGRHALIIQRLPETLETWLPQRLPYDHSGCGHS
ncbi:MAG: hypothetical protein H6R18_1101 [Proteobacteria bacterium]|nr:hypothetical protein [Pseudomonadota bacterium]